MKIKFGKIIAFLFAVIMAFALFSCGDETPVIPDQPAEPEIEIKCYLEDGTDDYFIEKGTSIKSITPPKREGYTFEGMFTDVAGGSKIFDSRGDKCVEIDRDMTLHAQWSPQTYYIIFEAEDSVLPADKEELEVKYGSSVTEFPIPEKEGYSFVGWYDADGAAYSKGASVIRDKQTVDSSRYSFTDKTAYLYPVFEIKKYNVTLEYNDGSGRNEIIKIAHGEKIDSALYPSEDTGSRRIKFWAVNYAADQNYSATVTSDITLYALWEEYRIITLNDMIGGEQTVEIVKNQRISMSQYSNITREGYYLEGWYTSENCSGNPVTEISYNTASSVYYANWKLVSYTLTFDANSAEMSIDSINYKMGEKVKLPELEKDEYIFLGWYSIEGEEPFKFIPENYKGDHTLYASFVLTKRNLTLESNGGSLEQLSVEVKNGESFNLPVPQKTGYIFLGWFDKNNAEKYTDENGKSVVLYDVVNHSSVMYAKWESKVYNVHVLGANINSYQSSDTKGNPRYDIEILDYLYYTRGDDKAAKGFYVDESLTQRVTVSQFDKYCIDEKGVCNFVFGGLVSSAVNNNGHSYLTYDNSCVAVSSNGTVLGMPAIDEESGVGILFAVISPKTYNAKFDFNVSAMPKLSLTNESNLSKSISVYYNEYPTKLNVMPESDYYVSTSYSDAAGEKYFNGDGTAAKVYCVSGDTTLYCRWDKKYAEYNYIYDSDTMLNISTTGKYIILCDINMGGIEWPSLDTFTGELNGSGHSVYNFSITKSGSGSANYAFINNNNGVIKDLTIGNNDSKYYNNQYSIKIDISFNESSSETYISVGGISANNTGEISGCKLSNAYIYVNVADKDNNHGLYVYVGGISTINSGTIYNCNLNNCYIDANVTADKDSGDDNYGWLGGICAKNHATLSDSTVYNTTLDLDVRGDGYLTNKAYPIGYLGGIVGEQLNGSTTSCTVRNITLNIYGSSGAYTEPTLYKENVCGKKTGGSVQ